MTACRWLTGEYPQFTDPTRDEHGVWRMDGVKLPDALEQVEPSLRAVVQRLLSVRPEERGTVVQLAEELEQAVRSGPGVAVRSAEPPPLAASPDGKSPTTEERSEEKRPADSARARRAARRMWPWLTTAAAGLMVAASVGWGVVEKLAEKSDVFSSTTGSSRADAGTAGLGDAVSVTPTVDSSEPSHPAMAEEPLPEPIPGQTRPDAKGRCPHRRQVALNGACWVPLDAEECEASFSSGQLFRGRCYVPDVPRKHPSTSSSPRRP